MFSEKMTNVIAGAAYAAVNSWDIAHGEKGGPAWEDVSDAVRKEVIGRIQLSLSDPRAVDATYHNQRLTHMKHEGWAYGPKYDEKARTDPTLIPYHQLSPQKQARERTFRAVALALGRV